MNRLILIAFCATAALGLAACGYDKDEYNGQAGYNAEEGNYADTGGNYEAPANELNMADVNGMNISDTGNAAGYEAAGNSAGN